MTYNAHLMSIMFMTYLKSCPFTVISGESGDPLKITWEPPWGSRYPRLRVIEYNVWVWVLTMTDVCEGCCVHLWLKAICILHTAYIYHAHCGHFGGSRTVVSMCECSPSLVTHVIVGASSAKSPKSKAIKSFPTCLMSTPDSTPSVKKASPLGFFGST